MSSESRNKEILEAMIFLSPGPMTAAELKSALEIPETDINDLMDKLIEEYSERDGGVLIGKVAGGYQMYTNPEFNENIRKLKGTVKAQKLSPAALETLAIIAYKQPITKAEIEEIRGVNSDGVMKSLFDRRLVKILGKKEAPGKPMLYGTTRDFLQHFGLNDLSELPTIKEFDREDSV